MSQNESCSSCKSNCPSASAPAVDPFSQVAHKVVVLSGKGGVGKSTVSVNLAYALSALGLRVGLLDVDIHGPSVPFMLGLENERCLYKGDWLLPVEVDGIKVMSVGFFFAQQEEALIWRGPRKTALIQQFVHGTDWGELDYLVIDSPPGTGDEPLSVCQAIPDIDGAVVVTTPQRVAVNDVKRSVTFCHRLNLPVLGVVENMSGFVCPKCGEVTQILPPGGGHAMAESMGIRFLGAIPMNPAIALAADSGQVYLKNQMDSPMAITLMEIARTIAQRPAPDALAENSNQETSMKIAIPLADGQLTAHFGHCAEFALITVDQAQKKITGRETVPAPVHEPGKLPIWLAEKGVTLVIAGGMGQRAQDIFVANGINVVVGAPTGTPDALVADWLAGTLTAGENCCDH